MKMVFKSVLVIGFFSAASAFASGELLTGSYQPASNSSDVNCPTGNAPSGIQLVATSTSIQETETIDYGIDGVAKFTNISLPVGDGVVAPTENSALQMTGGGVYHARYSADETSYKYAFIPTDATQGNPYSVTFSLTGNRLEITTSNDGQAATCHYLKSNE